jgi:DNA (cytosine-5)-methyltransferase 1
MNVVSLFSGVGGFDLGLEQAGMKTIYQCEWDKHATNILQRHWPHVPKWGDITTLTAQEILRHGKNPDVIAWGSPCQDLSVAGKRAGLEGERSGLFHEGMRIIKELRKETNNAYPRISIWENVAGALSSNRGADFGIILDEMAQAGTMVIEWAMLDAQHFGIPQRRRRVFVIAIFDPAIARNCPNPLLPVSESLRGNTQKGKPKRQTTSSQASTSIGGDGEWWDGGTIADAITTTSDAQRMPDKDRLQAVVQRTPNRLLGSNIIGSLNATDYKWPQNQQLDENKFVVQSKSNWSLVPVGVQWFSEAGVSWEEPTMAVRRLTPLECERLMGWPDDHTRHKADGTEQADTHRYKQCGNGVASPVAKWIAQHILNIPKDPAQ